MPSCHRDRARARASRRGGSARRVAHGIPPEWVKSSNPSFMWDRLHSHERRKAYTRARQILHAFTHLHTLQLHAWHAHWNSTICLDNASHCITCDDYRSEYSSSPPAESPNQSKMSISVPGIQ
jgi:hypothetical protein